MSEITSHTPGMICWTDLSTSDREGAKAFYERLFRYEYDDAPMGEPTAGGDNSYSIAKVRGSEVAGLYQLPAEMQAKGIPSAWLPYFAVESADDATARALALGGTVVEPPQTVEQVCRMAILADPTGAVFALFEPAPFPGALRVHEHGALDWAELNTYDIDRAERFYCDLFGYTTERSISNGHPYVVFFKDGRPAVGMMPILEEWGPGIPPNWLVYFNVEDCDAALAIVEAEGGRVVMAPMDVPGVGRFAVLADPQGAVLSIITPVEAPIHVA